MVNSFRISANPKDVKYLNVDTRVRGYGPNRLKALELEGRWVLSPDSIPFITEAFKQIERLNGPGGMPELAECHKNAIGQHNWTSDQQLNIDTTGEFAEPGRQSIRRSVLMQRSPRSQSVQSQNLNIGRRSESPLPLPPLPPIQTENLPHRTNGYGSAAHQYKRYSPTNQQQHVLPRSQSVSPRSVADAIIQQDRPYQQRVYCTKLGGTGPEDPGYYSSYSYTSSNQNSPVKAADFDRPPHRTQPLSDYSHHRYSSTTSNNNNYDNDYDDSILRRANSLASLGRDRWNTDRRIRWALPTKREHKRYTSSSENLYSPGSNRQHFYEPVWDKQEGLEHLTAYQGEFKKRLPGGRVGIDHFRWP